MIQNDNKKIKDFYKEFCDAVKLQVEDRRNPHQVNIHDVLIHMKFLAVADEDDELRSQEQPAVSTEVVRSQRKKYTV